MPSAYSGRAEEALQSRRRSIQSAKPRGAKDKRRGASGTASSSAPTQDAEVARLTLELASREAQEVT
jgi:hypothetical protein